jgi:hypothetical protein
MKENIMTDATLIDYTFEIDEEVEGKVWFTLNMFPTIKFSYTNLRVLPSTSNREDGSISYSIEAKYQITHGGDAEAESEEANRIFASAEFLNLVREFMTHLLSVAAKTVDDIAASDDEKTVDDIAD